MRLEFFPLILGVIVGLIGLALLFDAWAPDEVVIPKERRQQPRRDRDRWGEALVGLGVLAIAAAFLGRDTWRYTSIAVIAGAILLTWGAKRNSFYLRGAFTGSDRLRRLRPGTRRIR